MIIIVLIAMVGRDSSSLRIPAFFTVTLLGLNKEKQRRKVIA